MPRISRLFGAVGVAAVMALGLGACSSNQRAPETATTSYGGGDAQAAAAAQQAAQAAQQAQQAAQEAQKAAQEAQAAAERSNRAFDSSVRK
jgi:hypothetical protein